MLGLNDLVSCGVQIFFVLNGSLFIDGNFWKLNFLWLFCWGFRLSVHVSLLLDLLDILGMRLFMDFRSNS
jgi:hypothetical protein